MPDADSWVRQEINRLRDRIHDIETTLRAVELFTLRLDGIERNVRDIDQTVRELDKQVRALATADAIADAVAERVGALDELARKRSFTALQRWGVRAGIVGALVAGAGEIIRLWVGG